MGCHIQKHLGQHQEKPVRSLYITKVLMTVVRAEATGSGSNLCTKEKEGEATLEWVSKLGKDPINDKTFPALDSKPGEKMMQI